MGFPPKYCILILLALQVNNKYALGGRADLKTIYPRVDGFRDEELAWFLTMSLKLILEEVGRPPHNPATINRVASLLIW